MARVKAGFRHPTNVDWRTDDREPADVGPDAGDATRSEVSAALAGASVAPVVPSSPAGAHVRQATIAGMSQPQAAAPAAAPVGSPGRLNKKGTIVGMTGIGGGALPQEREPAVTVYGSEASENAAADYELFSTAIGLLKDAGVDGELARQIVLGEVAKERVDDVRAYLASLGVDQKTCLAVLWGRRIIALPVITPPSKSSSSAVPHVAGQGHGSPTLPPSEGSDSRVDAVSGDVPATGSVVLDSEIQADMARVAAVSSSSNRALVAAVLVGLGIAGALGYSALNSFADNVAHSAPARR